MTAEEIAALLIRDELGTGRVGKDEASRVAGRVVARVGRMERAEELRASSKAALRLATERFRKHGPRDARGAAMWDMGVWLDERAAALTNEAPDA
jgi:hypothetical protein